MLRRLRPIPSRHRAIALKSDDPETLLFTLGIFVNSRVQKTASKPQCYALFPQRVSEMCYEVKCPENGAENTVFSPVLACLNINLEPHKRGPYPLLSPLYERGSFANRG